MSEAKPGKEIVSLDPFEDALLRLPLEVRNQVPEDTSLEMVRAASKFYELAAAMPAVSGDASADILLRVFNATAFDEVDQAWRTTPDEELFDRDMEILEATLHPSEFAGAMPVYAYVSAVDVKDGQVIGFSDGSMFVLAQLAQLYNLGVVPGVIVRLIRSKRPTAKGFYPHHLAIMGKRA